MAKKLYYEFQLNTTQDYGDEIVYEDGVVASSSASAKEAVGGHCGCCIGLPYIRLYDSIQGQDSERDSEESDANVGESSGHPECSLELDPEDLNTSAAGVARIPQRHQGPQNHFRFTRRQIQKMEQVFKKSQCPDLAVRYVAWTKSSSPSLASGSC